ncbi:MAG: LysE family translocator [Cellvibrionaceae bacterium]
MSLLAVVTLLAIMIGLAALPSTSVALVVTQSASRGFASGIATSIGIVLGDLLLITLAVFGLTAISAIAGTFFFIIKCLACAYLIVLGINLIKNKSTDTKFAVTNSSQFSSQLSVAEFFAQGLCGLLITLADIKAIFFYASLLPLFINFETLSFIDIIILWVITVLSVGGIKVGYVFMASSKQLKTYIQKILKRELKSDGLQQASGIFMIGAGSYLIIKS